MKIHATAIATLALAPAVACSGGDRWTGTVTDSAGVLIVTNTEDGVWGPSEAWTFEEDLRIGAVEGDLDYQFGQVGTIAVDSKRNIYVSDIQARQVKVYSQDGTFVRTVGGPGAGPGELSPQAAYALIAPGDTLLVPDTQNRRINRYAPDGTILESVPIEIEKGLPLVFRSTRSGSIAVQIQPLGLPDSPTPDSMDAVVAIGPSGVFGDTIMRFPSGRVVDFSGGAPEINLFMPGPVWLVTDDGAVLYGRSNEYRIGRYDQEGTLERTFTMPFERTQVGERDKQAIFTFLDRAWTDAGVPPSLLTQLHSLVRFGEFYPAFVSLQAGYRNTIWVQQIQSAQGLTDEELADFNLIEESGSPDWDVFGSDGRFLGVVTMPPRFRPSLFLDNEIYGVWRDDLDVQYVMRLRIVEG